MTGNPLARRRQNDGALTGSKTYSTMALDECMAVHHRDSDRHYTLRKTAAGFAQDMVDMLNEQLRRPDLEWAVNADGSSWSLRSRPGVIAQRIADDKRRVVDEARKALHRAQYPIDSLRDQAA